MNFQGDPILMKETCRERITTQSGKYILDHEFPMGQNWFSGEKEKESEQKKIYVCILNPLLYTRTNITL